MGTSAMREMGPNDRRLALLDAAQAVIAERGLRGFTHRAVAAVAGVTHGLVRHYFGSLDTMLKEALALSVERDIAHAPPAITAPIDELARHLPAHIAATEAQQAFQYEVSLESRRRPELVDDVRRVYATYISAMQNRLRVAGLPDDEMLARAVFAMLDGLAFEQLVVADAEETAEALEWLRRMLRALAAAE